MHYLLANEAKGAEELVSAYGGRKAPKEKGK